MAISIDAYLQGFRDDCFVVECSDPNSDLDPHYVRILETDEFAYALRMMKASFDGDLARPPGSRFDYPDAAHALLHIMGSSNHQCFITDSGLCIGSVSQSLYNSQFISVGTVFWWPGGDEDALAFALEKWALSLEAATIQIGFGALPDPQPTVRALKTHGYHRSGTSMRRSLL